jgi:hypothetical protein
MSSKSLNLLITAEGTVGAGHLLVLAEITPIYKVVVWVCNATIGPELSGKAVSNSLQIAPGLRTIQFLIIIYTYLTQ